MRRICANSGELIQIIKPADSLGICLHAIGQACNHNNYLPVSPGEASGTLSARRFWGLRELFSPLNPYHVSLCHLRHASTPLQLDRLINYCAPLDIQIRCPMRVHAFFVEKIDVDGEDPGCNIESSGNCHGGVKVAGGGSNSAGHWKKGETLVRFQRQI